MLTFFPLLTILQIVVCGYLVHGWFSSHQFFGRRLLRSKEDLGYILYFRILVLGYVWFLIVQSVINSVPIIKDFLEFLIDYLLINKDSSGKNSLDGAEKSNNSLLFKDILSDSVPFILAFFIRGIDHLHYIFRIKGDIIREYERNLMRVAGEVPEEYLVRSSRRSFLTMFTMEDNKVYTGWLKEFIPDSNMEWISILPATSGHREKETRKVFFTVNYLQHYETSEPAKMAEKALDIFLPMKKIVSIQKFDFDFYNKNMELEIEKKEKAQASQE